MTSSTLPFPAATPTAAQLIAENVNLRAESEALRREVELSRRSIRLARALVLSLDAMHFNERYEPVVTMRALREAIREFDRGVRTNLATQAPPRSSMGGTGTAGEREG